jgi:MoaA/NifB/PqqE/SkfB family radical SAM enzyme
VSVSSVLSRESIRNGETERLVSFLASLGVDEAWLSEVKPTVSAFWSDDLVITEEERLQLVRMQDAHNRALRDSGGMVINYLGHFEGCENFGCNAGCKMVYVDAFGEVSPCVFLPMSFGNVRERPLADTLGDMRSRFPAEGRCFINRNYRALSVADDAPLPIDRAQTVGLLERVTFGSASRFNRRLYGRRAEA